MTILNKIPIGVEVCRERGFSYLFSFLARGYSDLLIVKANHLASAVDAALSARPLFHVIGDSHSWAFKRNRSFIVHNIGPATAYNLANPGSTVRSSEKLFHIIDRMNVKRDAAILVFGEIDCRVHIYNQFKKNNGQVPVAELIGRTIGNYGAVLQKLSDRGVNFYVYGVLPATRHVFRYPPYATRRMREALFREFNERYPYLAPPGVRAEIHREYNERLRAFCHEHHYKFIDIYPRVSDSAGFVREEFIADEIHVNGKVMEFIKETLQ